MRNLLRASDRDRLVLHLRGPLLREVAVEGRRLTALAEADGAEGGSFCDATANARAAELLVQPEVHDIDPGFAEAVLDFVMAMADAALPCRRAAVGGIELLRADPRDFEILTPFHRFTGDLGAGVIRQQLRGPLEALPPVTHTGNLVEFRLARHRACVDVEDNIRDIALRRVGDDLVLSHESLIPGRAGLLRPREVTAGTLRYDYSIAAGSPLLRLAVSFTAAAEKVSALRLTGSVDAMDAGGLELAEAALGGPGGWQRHGTPAEAGLATWAEAAPVAHVGIGQEGWPDGAPCLHIRPGEPRRIASIKATAVRSGTLRWLLLRHGPVELPPGGLAVAREDRLLAAGTGAEAAARAMQATAAAGLDLDPLATDGAALNAVASQLLFDACGAYRSRLSARRRAVLEAWLARHSAALSATAAGGLADLARAALAAEAERRAGGGAAVEARLRDLVTRLLARQAPGGGFREPDGRIAGPAAHAVALLALARALTQIELPGLAAAIGAALAAVGTGVVEATAIGGRATRIDGLAVAEASPLPLRAHAEAVGLLARAAGAVVLAAEASGGALAPETVALARSLHGQAVALARPLVRVRGMALEVMPSPLGGAATPAGQAAVTLGLLAPEAMILRLGTAGARVAA